MMRTLKDACKDFYGKGFVKFEYITPDTGILTFKDADGIFYEEINRNINGRRVPSDLKMIIDPPVK